MTRALNSTSTWTRRMSILKDSRTRFIIGFVSPSFGRCSIRSSISGTKRTSGSRLQRCLSPARTTATSSYIKRLNGSWKISGPMCRGISRRSIPISRCSTNRARHLRRSPAHARSRAQKVFITFTLAMCTTASAAARGVPAAANYSSSAIGTSSANGTLKTADADLAITRSLGSSKSNAGIGARGGCQSGWQFKETSNAQGPTSNAEVDVCWTLPAFARKAELRRGRQCLEFIMFVGHYSVAFAAKSEKNKIPLWILFIAVQFLDYIWATLVLLGIEKVRVIKGFTAGSMLDSYFHPYSHSLIGAIIWSGVAALIYWAACSRHGCLYRKSAAVI